MMSKRIDLSDKKPALISWLRSRMPEARNISISDLERSGGGLSNETFFFNMSWEEAGQTKTQRMVLRCPPTAFPVFPEYDLSKQFRIMKALGTTGVPVPEVLWFEEKDDVLGVPFYVMRFMQGVVAPEYPPYHSFGLVFDATPQRREKMWWGGVEAMAKIHNLDWKRQGFTFLDVPSNASQVLDSELNYYEKFLDWVKKDEPQPILEAALRWLRDNKPVPKHVTLCWGDCRLPNLILDAQDEVAAVVDWEMAGLSDPESDLAWYLFLDWQHCDGYGIPRLEGFPGREETIKRYEELTGITIENLFYYEVLAAFKFGVILLKVFKNFKEMGVALPADDAEANNVCTQRLASLLKLEPPGERKKREVTRVDEVTVTAQFHFTGPGGTDWYLISDKGQATRHEGTAPSANVSVTVSADDWAAIQRGDMDRIHAWTSGKLKIDGDMALLLQLEDTIAKLRQEEQQ